MEGVVCRCAVHNWISRLIFGVVGCVLVVDFGGISYWFCISKPYVNNKGLSRLIG
jgi:hypothetical protein